jgi:site-specific recombinase XerD
VQIFNDNRDAQLPADVGLHVVPALVRAAGDRGAYRFLEFFAAHIRNPNTRAAYFRDVCAFFSWCEQRHVTDVSEIRSGHVAGYIERMTKTHAAPSVKQHLAAIRMLFNWLVVGQIVEHNPAAAVRGPKHIVKKGKTPVLLGEEARRLLDSITIESRIGLRDRALIALLIYTFARVSAAVHMKTDDVYVQGRRLWVRLHEKGGKEGSVANFPWLAISGMMDP